MALLPAELGVLRLGRVRCDERRLVGGAAPGEEQCGEQRQGPAHLANVRR
jgi:hypothetical protein